MLLGPFEIVWKNRSIRMSAIALFFMGVSFAASTPYQALMALDDLGMSDGAFSMLMLTSAITNVLIAVALGILSDQVSNRKPMILATALIGMGGFGSFYLAPSIPLFALNQLILQPIGGAGFSLIFSAVRAETGKMAPNEAGPVNSIVRTAFSAAFILTPALVGLHLSAGRPLIEAWGVSAIGYGVMFLIYWIFAPGSRQQLATGGRLAHLGGAARILASRRVILAILASAVVCGPQQLTNVIGPLIVKSVLGGTNADVGFLAGGVALLEIPFVLACGMLLGRLSSGKVMAFSALVFVGFLVGLGMATATWQVYALLIVEAAGSAALISVPMTYLQDLVPERPGLGTSLLLLSQFVSQGLNAVTFALGTAWSGYQAIALIGAFVTLVGVVMLLALETKREGNALPGSSH